MKRTFDSQEPLRVRRRSRPARHALRWPLWLLAKVTECGSQPNTQRSQDKQLFPLLCFRLSSSSFKRATQSFRRVLRGPLCKTERRHRDATSLTKWKESLRLCFGQPLQAAGVLFMWLLITYNEGASLWNMASISLLPYVFTLTQKLSEGVCKRFWIVYFCSFFNIDLTLFAKLTPRSSSTFLFYTL